MAFYHRGPDVDCWKWLVLLAFSVNSAHNSFMYMDFATVADVSEETFRWVDANGVPRDDAAATGRLNWESGVIGCAVMANAAGCALGTVLIPAVVRNTGPSYHHRGGAGSPTGSPKWDGVVPGDAGVGRRQLERAVFVQALVGTACPVLTLLFHRERPARAVDAEPVDCAG
eukprot:gene34717-44432_t